MGFAQVWVDGKLTATIDLRAGSMQPSRVVWRRTWAQVGTHTVRIRALGTVGRPRVEIDAFVILR